MPRCHAVSLFLLSAYIFFMMHLSPLIHLVYCFLPLYSFDTSFISKIILPVSVLIRFCFIAATMPLMLTIDFARQIRFSLKAAIIAADDIVTPLSRDMPSFQSRSAATPQRAEDYRRFSFASRRHAAELPLQMPLRAFSRCHFAVR